MMNKATNNINSSKAALMGFLFVIEVSEIERAIQLKNSADAPTTIMNVQDGR